MFRRLLPKKDVFFRHMEACAAKAVEIVRVDSVTRVVIGADHVTYVIARGIKRERPDQTHVLVDGRAFPWVEGDFQGGERFGKKSKADHPRLDAGHGVQGEAADDVRELVLRAET